MNEQDKTYTFLEIYDEIKRNDQDFQTDAHSLEELIWDYGSYKFADGIRDADLRYANVLRFNNMQVYEEAIRDTEIIHGGNPYA